MKQRKRIWLSILTSLMFGALALSNDVVYAERADSAEGAFMNNTPATRSDYKGTFGAADRVTPVYSTTETDIDIKGNIYEETPYRQFHELPRCPKPTICPNIRGEYTTSGTGLKDNEGVQVMRGDDNYFISYSDISKYTPEDQNSICPRVCTATRKIIMDPSDSKKIKNHFPAQCPDGYSQVGMYNVQDEVIYNPTEKDLPFPVSYNDYEDYIDKGYNCNNRASGYLSGGSISKCSGASYGAPSTTNATFDYPLRKNVFYSGGPKGPGMVYFTYVYPQGLSDKFWYDTAGYIYVGNTDYCRDSVAPFNCNTTWQTNCYLSCDVNKNTNSTYIKCKKRYYDAAHVVTYYMDYKYTLCKMDPGFYYTNNKIPVSIVCARQTPVFKKQ